MNKKTILITGGLGYIGSHAVVFFEQNGYKTIIIDNLINSNIETLSGIRKILGYIPKFYECDIADRGSLRSIFDDNHIDAVLHFASLKAIGESCEKPFRYYDNNLFSSIILFEIMQEYGIKDIIFSSSASIYDSSNPLPWREDGKLHAIHPYGNIKIAIEYALQDLASYHNWRVVALRYFNPIGAHSSGYIGENPRGVPNNLLPYVLDVALGKREYVGIFGKDYPTPDGTCIRDYIDIDDLVRAHFLAYIYLEKQEDSTFQPINLGAGKGRSVMEVISVTEEIVQKTIPKRILSRRDGDLPEFYADTTRAGELLGWTPMISLSESIQTAWNYTVFSHTRMSSPLVSVILPTYNPKKDWITLAIRSVLEQSYEYFELLIIDDASTNGVIEEIDSLIRSDSRIVLIKNNKNLKLTKTLNIGIEQATGKYIARIDDDDIWSNSEKLQRQVQFLEHNPSYGLVGTGVIVIDESGNKLDEVDVRLSDIEIRNNILKDSQFAHASVLIRHDTLKDIGMYDPKWNMVEDYELWLRIGTKFKFSNLPDKFLFYRINSNGVSKKNEFTQKKMSLFLTCKYRGYYPHFIRTLILKIPYTILPKKISLFILKILKK